MAFVLIPQVNQSDLAPWLEPLEDNQDYFYDNTRRSHWPRVSEGE